MNHTPLAIIVLISLFTLIAPIGALAEAPPATLYRITDEHPGFDKRSAGIAGAAAEVAIAIDAAAVDSAPDVLHLPLPDGRQVTAAKERFTASPGLLSWSGLIAGGDTPPGFVLLVDRGERISGVVNVGSDRFQIVPAELGHRLVRIELESDTCFITDAIQGRHFDEGADEAGLHPTEGHDLHPAISEDIQSLAQYADPSPDIDGQPSKSAKNVTVIDLLAIYPNSFSGAEEIAAREFIEDSVVLANEVFAMSQIDAQYQLVDMVKLTAADQPPATGLIDAIEWMTPEQMAGQDPDELGPPEMLALREQYAADMVALFIPLSYGDDNFCGIANLPEQGGNLRPYFPGLPTHGEFGKRAFTANRAQCGLGDFTLAHELGHNFGMRHDNENTDPSVHLFTYGRGHLPPQTPWQSNANGTLQTDFFGEFAMGYHFTPRVDGKVIGLGGLWNGEKRVRLWEMDPLTLHRQVFLDPQNDWAYEAITPFDVVAGKTYTLAVYIDGDGGSIYHDPIPFPQTYNGLVTIEGTTFISTANDPNAEPTNTVTNIMYGQVDIQFVAISSVMGCLRESGDITGAVCNRVPHFSDPDILYQGLATGTATRDNGRVAELQVGPYSQFGDNNSAPNCQDDFLSTTVDTILPIALGSILGNDSDPNGDSIRLADYDTTTAQGGSNDTGHVFGFNYTPPSGFSGTDWFNYTISDRPEGHPAAQFDTCTVYIDVQEPVQTIGEVGEVSLLTHVPRTVFLTRDYTNPVVIAQTVSENETDTAVVRITDLQGDRFTFYVHEAPDQDGTHSGETVAYLVLEAGNWRLPSGELLRVGTLQTSKTVGRLVANQWESLSFGPLSSSIPILLSQVQTNGDPSWVKTRHRSVAASGAQLALEKSEADASSHGLETIGWIAIEPGSGNWNGRQFVAARTPNAVTDQPYTLSSGISIVPPRLFAAMATYDGPDNAALRFGGGLSPYVRVEEDTTRDAETVHTTEVVGYLTITGSGVLTGTPE